MLTINSYSNRSQRSWVILFRVWVYNHLKAFADQLERSLVNSFTKSCEVLENDFVRVSNLSAKEARVELKAFKQMVIFIDRLDRSIENTESRKIKMAFSPFKKMVYKTEARLHKMSYKNEEILATDEVLKQKMSDFGRESILSHL